MGAPSLMEEAAPSSLTHTHACVHTHAHTHTRTCRLECRGQLSCASGLYTSGQLQIEEGSLAVPALSLCEPDLNPQQNLRTQCITGHLDSHLDLTITASPMPSEFSTSPSTTLGLVGSLPWGLPLSLTAAIPASYLETLAEKSFQEVALPHPMRIMIFSHKSYLGG